MKEKIEQAKEEPKSAPVGVDWQFLRDARERWGAYVEENNEDSNG